MASDRLTDRGVKALEAPDKGNSITYDTEVKGFGVRITAAGAKAFILNYYIHGRERRFTIGSYPDWSVAAARDEAKRLKRDIDQGHDPLGKRIENREAPTVNDLWKEYEKKHLPTKRARSAADDRSMWENYILPKFRAEKVRDLTPHDIDGLHTEISTTKPVRANRVLEVFRKALELAVRWGWRADNPAKGFKRNQEEKRERYLKPEEIHDLDKALDAHPNKIAVNAIKLLLLTGARKSEVLGATWAMFDLKEGVWIKPSAHTKQNKVHRVPLSKTAVTLLKGIRDADDADPIYVFPGEGDTGHLVEIKRTWATVMKTAKLAGLRLHDLRHTYASVLASNRVPLHVVGALLGHTQAQTTERYAHLYDDPLRQATEAAAKVVNGETKKRRKADG